MEEYLPAKPEAHQVAPSASSSSSAVAIIRSSSKNSSMPPTPGKVGSDNPVTINIGTGPSADKPCSPATTALTLQPQPIELKVDTPTDWPAVLASTTVAFAVGLMALMGQRQQVRASKANFRKEWQRDLRETAAKLLGIAAEITSGVSDNPNFWSSSESTEPFCRLIEYQTKIALLLDPRKKISADINELMVQIVKEIKKPNNEGSVNKLVSDFANHMANLLELAWQDMKSDLDGKGFFGIKR